MKKLYNIKPNLFNIVTFLLAMLLSSFQLTAQGWERFYQLEDYEFGSTDDMEMTPDGGYVLVGTVRTADTSDIGLAVIKVDVEGELQWSKVYGDTLFTELGQEIIPLADGTYVIGGITFNNPQQKADHWLFKIDAFGENILWEHTFGLDDKGEYLNSVIQTPDDGFLLLGEWAPLTHANLIKVDANGIEEWSNQVGPDNDLFSEGRRVALTSDGGYIVTGKTKTDFFTDESDLLFIKVDANGNEEWSTYHGDQYREAGEAVVEASDGGFVAAGLQSSGGTYSVQSDIFISKVDVDGNPLWNKRYGLPWTYERAFSIIKTDDDGYLIAGNSTDAVNDGTTYLVRTDAQGDTLWTKKYNTNQAGGWAIAVHQTPDSGFVIGGSNDFTLTLLKTNSLGESYTSILEGNVYHDLNDDCNYNVGENTLAGWYILAEGNNEEYVGITDENGYYQMVVDSGMYEVSVYPANALWEACPASTSVVLTQYDTTSIDLFAKSVVDCPHLTVDISTPYLRRCFENNYYVKYSNDGTLDETDAYIEIQFDEFLTVNSSSIPFTDLGNNFLSFDIGSVPVGTSGDFSVNVTVDCDSTILGQTHCSIAHIYPDSSCLVPSPLWDESEIEVSGVCMGDSVLFEIRNVGTGAMIEPGVAQIIIDDVVVLIELFNLGVGQVDTVIQYPAGQTARIEAIQSNDFPGMSMPIAVVEGCGNASNISTGFVTQFPMDDEESFIDIDCQQNQGSFDPNLKKAYPNGYSNENFISAEDEIEYHIKFQNTGTDTAFTVVVRDTLSDFLDLSTVRPGSSSHPYNYTIDENKTLKFTFENILLPDSTTNEMASHGYVKFNINQRPNNAPGTVIHNNAAIYFDFNPPIITEDVFLTIEKPTVIGVEEANICEGDLWWEMALLEDTIFKDSFPSDKQDSLHLTWVHVLDTNIISEDVFLNAGETYQDTLYFSDTTFYYLYKNENGCDSIVEFNISINDKITPSPIHSFDAFPNPAYDQFQIVYNLFEPQEIRLSIYDALGREVMVLADNEIQQIGHHRFIINTENSNIMEHSSQVWFLHFQTKRGRTVRKIIVGNSF